METVRLNTGVRKAEYVAITNALMLHIVAIHGMV